MSDPSKSKQSKPNLSIPQSTTQDEPAPALAQTSKKKSRLQWDEENLITNAAELERAGPRMKIDEPKTPYLASETGSSTSGSAHQSPPESPSFISHEQLVGFSTLERQHGGSMGNASSDGFSSAGSGARSVHISDEVFASSGGSSPHSSEGFVARRNAHYRNEAKAIAQFRRLSQDGIDDEDDEEEGKEKNNNDQQTNGFNARRNAHYRNEARAMAQFRRFSQDGDDEDDDEEEDEEINNDHQPNGTDNRVQEHPLDNGNVTADLDQDTRDNITNNTDGSIPNGHTRS